MIGVITSDHIKEIELAFGRQVAEAAKTWTGTLLDLLKHMGVL